MTGILQADKVAVTRLAGCYNDHWNGVIVDDAFAHP